MEKIEKYKNKNFLMWIITFLYVASMIFEAFLIKWIFDSVQNNGKTFFSVLSLFIIFVIIKPLIYYTYVFYKYNYIYKKSKAVKDKIFSSFIEMDFENFYKSSDGDKFSTLTNDMKILEDSFYNPKFNMIKSIMQLIFAVISIFYLNYILALSLILISSLAMLIPEFLSKNLSSKQNEVSKNLSSLTSTITEYIAGFNTIKSFSLTDLIIKKFKKESKTTREVSVEFQNNLTNLKTLAQILGLITWILNFLLGLFLVSKNIIGFGTVMAIAQLSNSATNPIGEIIDYKTSIESSKGVREKLFSIVKMKNMISDRKIELDKFKDGLNVENLSFSYDDDEVLHDINFSFKPNKKYAIIGSSGSGKSTFLNILSRKISKIEGQIKIDGIDINSIGESFFDITSVIPQDTFLLKGTIYDNITLFSDKYEEKDVKYAMEKSGLSKFMDKLYIKDFIDDKGTNLSGGERQRISIARSVIKHTDIIFADEALASLDNKTADEIEKTLLSSESTLISVTHRIIVENLKKYDDIIYIKEGRIKNHGNYDFMISHEDEFKNLVLLSQLGEENE